MSKPNYELNIAIEVKLPKETTLSSLPEINVWYETCFKKKSCDVTIFKFLAIINLTIV